MLDRLVVSYDDAAVAGNAGIDETRVERVVENLSRLSDQYNLIVVTAGELATGNCLWEKTKGSQVSKPEPRTLASIGSVESLNIWQKAFISNGLLANPMLLGRNQVEEKGVPNDTIKQMRSNIAADIISLVGLNYAVDNAADRGKIVESIAIKVWAEQTCFMTNIDGLTDGNGRIIETIPPTSAKHEEAKKFAELAAPKRPGIISIVNACVEIVNEGYLAHIAHFNSDIQDVINGHSGTHFLNH